MSKILLLLPNQLFKIKYINEIMESSKCSKIVIYHHQSFYGYRKSVYMNFNQKKIMLHHASSLYYYDQLKELYTVSSILDPPQYKNMKEIYMFDPLDEEIEEELTELYTNIGVRIIISQKDPRFLTTLNDLEYIHGKIHVKKLNHKSFYSEVMKLLDLPKLKSTDSENRNVYPISSRNDYEYNKEIALERLNFIGDGNKYSRSKIEEIPNVNIYNTDFLENQYIEKAKIYVNKFFQQNPGNTDNFFIPISHNAAEMFLLQFLRERFYNFAKYQDSIVPSEPFMFHSLLSSVMNIGLLTPEYIIDTTLDYYDKNRRYIDFNNVEAFIRQIAGWREYQRYIYKYHSYIRTYNFFSNERLLTERWYNGTTGIRPVDDCIKKGFEFGYLHHIERLMIIANFMNLCRIHPEEAYIWFMEFSTDSYDWVMLGNVLSMGLYADGGLTMRKPYISSSNYISKISGGRYSRNEDWAEIWDDLYKMFVIDFSEDLRKTRCCPFIKLHKNDENSLRSRYKEYIDVLTVKK